jgi:CO/xanthine dehydrogenase Mo-binding subunit
MTSRRATGPNAAEAAGRVAGQDKTRKDIYEKVTGSAKYTSDLEVAGMAYAALARSRHAHGLIRSIDVAAAQAVPGVVCVVTARDFDEVDLYYGETVFDQPFLADDRVRYVGEPVAGVVAETEDIARRAAELVEVEVEPLPVMGDAASALRADTLIHPERPQHPELPNICASAEFVYGDVDAAMASARYVHEATYTFPAVYHYAMEPYACLASWDHDGLDMWSGTQQPQKVRADLARMFGVPMSRVRLRVPYVGGAYGSKGQAKYEPVTAALALKSGRPVRLVTSIDEAMHTVTRHAAVIEMRTAIDTDGNLLARDTRIVYDTGAYADKGPRVARKGAYRASGPYEIPHTRAVGLAVYTNRVPAGAFRGFSTPQVVWAGESAIDEIARYLGVDPLEYRRERLTPRGRPFLGNDALMDADLSGGVQRAADAIGWRDPLPAGRGRGVASGVKDGGGGASLSQAEVHLNRDGSIEVFAATAELGQGSRTVLAQLAAEGLCAEYDDVHVRMPDTTAQQMDPGTNASRSTISVGAAVLQAAARIHDDLCGIAERALGASAELRLRGTEVLIGNDRTVPLVDLMTAATGLAPEFLGPMVAQGANDTSQGDGPLGHTSSFYEVGHAAVEIEVDEETGIVTLTDLASVADVGYAINPQTCEGQDEGALMMGIGHTMFEELEFSDGELQNASLVEYRVPRVEDLPKRSHTILLENRDGPGPFGSKGAGEGGTLAVAPAIANALHDATGVRVRDLPLTPERVWRALRARAEESADEAEAR